MSGENYALVDAVNQTQVDMLDQMGTIRAYILTQDPQLLDRQKDRRDTFDRDIEAAKHFAENQPQLLPMLDALKVGHTSWQNELAEPQLKFAADPATHDKAVALLKSSLSRLREKDVRGKAEVVFRAARAWSETESAAAATATATIKTTLLAGALLAVGLSILMGVLLARAIGRPVVAMTSAMSALAAGDMRIAVPGGGRRDELGRMAAAVQTFNDASIARPSSNGTPKRRGARPRMSRPRPVPSAPPRRPGRPKWWRRLPKASAGGWLPVTCRSASKRPSRPATTN